jgi:hypothetical protein
MARSKASILAEHEAKIAAIAIAIVIAIPTAISSVAGAESSNLADLLR